MKGWGVTNISSKISFKTGAKAKSQQSPWRYPGAFDSNLWVNDLSPKVTNIYRPANIPVGPEFIPATGKKFRFPGSSVKIPVSCPLFEIFCGPIHFLFFIFCGLFRIFFFSYSFHMQYRTYCQ